MLLFFTPTIVTKYIMAKEIAASQYYVHYSYVPGYYYLYKALENWLAERLFRNDKSRVFCASNDYAFRRRFELTDTSQNYKDLEVSSLRFPFANYWPQNNGWQVDTRPAANTAALIYIGIYEGTTKIRAAAGAITVPTTFYFDREDDARMAYERLYFYTYNEHNYSTEAIFSNQILELPMIITVSNLRFNPSYNETDWLKQNRIFIVSVDMVLRSYILYPPKQPNYDVFVNSAGLLTDKDGNLINPEGNYETDGEGFYGSYYDDGSESYYPTEEVILIMQSYYGLDLESIKVNGTVDESTIEVNQLYIDNISTDSATVKWDIDNVDQITSMEISYRDLKEFITVNPEMKEYQLSDLSPGSIYNVYIRIKDKFGTVKKLGRTFETLEDNSLNYENADGTPTNSLVGISW